MNTQVFDNEELTLHILSFICDFETVSPFGYMKSYSSLARVNKRINTIIKHLRPISSAWEIYKKFCFCGFASTRLNMSTVINCNGILESAFFCGESCLSTMRINLIMQSVKASVVIYNSLKININVPLFLFQCLRSYPHRNNQFKIKSWTPWQNIVKPEQKHEKMARYVYAGFLNLQKELVLKNNLIRIGIF
jgi:hypothetical protein